MSETALKFGPEWLRVLSHGGSVNSPPPSPGIKFKLAEHRYGREEMLALFNKHQSPPDGIESLGSLYVEEPQEPLAFLPMNDEEQRMWQRCVNSEAVLRQSGRAPVNGVGRGRGGSVDRGRGRGRGAGPYYSRGLSYDEEIEPRGPREGGPPGMSLRSKPFERSQSVHEQRAWSERSVGGSGVPSGPEDRNGAVSPRKEQGRASTENWRSRGGENEDTERWRGVGTSRNEKWGTRGWRERENGSENDWDEGVGRGTGRGVPVSSRTSRPPWDEKDGRLRKSWEDDNLPEWATDNTDEKGGSFDASGAYHAPGWSDEEESSVEGRPGDGRVRQKHSPDKQDKVEAPVNMHDLSSREHEGCSPEGVKNGTADVHPKPPTGETDKDRGDPNSLSIGESQPGLINGSKKGIEEMPKSQEKPNLPSQPQQPLHPPQQQPQPVSIPNGIVSDEEEVHEVQRPPPEYQVVPSPVQPPQPKLQIDPGSFPPREYQAEEEKLEHMRSVADDLVAKLVEEDDLRLQTGSPSQVGVPPGSLGPLPDPSSLTNHAAHPPGDEKWYYMDPQGEVQGPFTSSDMSEWYRAGYFTPTLLLKRECDDQFAQLGDLTRIFGRVPFAHGPLVSPLKVTEVFNAQKQAERERLEMLQSYMLQKQVYQHQIAVSRQQVLQKLQSMEEWSSLNPLQQQQLFMQHMMNVIPPHPGVVPNVPPSSAPPTAIPPSTQVPAPNPDHRVVAGPDMRVLPGPVPPPVSKPQDPIQALVAQMQTSSAASSTPIPNASDGMLTSQLTATSIAAENPLQKLLLQLQRGQQPGIGSMGSQSGALGSTVSVGGVTTPSTASGGGPLDNSPPDQQFDAIQSLMQQLSKMQSTTQDPIQEEHQRRQQEEDQKRLEERRRLEEQKRAEEERIRLEELRIKEELKRQEEQRRNLEALRRQHEEETQRIEEEKRKMREEQARRAEEIRRIEEDKMKKEEEQKRKLLEQQRVEAKRRQDELRQQQQKQQEEAKLKEEARRQEEVHRQLEEEKKRKEEEEQRRQEEEEEARHQAQVQEEMRRISLEEERRHMQQIEEEERKRQAKEEERRQQHLLQEHLKNMLPAWNTPPPVQAPEDAPAPSLIDIQRAQEEKERKEREVEQQLQQQRQREAQRQAAEEVRQKNSGLKWASMAQANPPPTQPVKSLLEIQAEEEKELKKRQEKEHADRAAAVSHMSLGAAGVWGSAVSNLSWANRASTTGARLPTPSTPPTNQGTSQQQWGGGSGNNNPAGIWNSTSQSPPSTNASSHSVWNNDHSTIWNQADQSPSTEKVAGGFWDNPEPTTKNNKPSPAPVKSASKAATSSNKGGSGNQGTSNNKTSKKKGKDESDAVKKLFSDNMSPADDFTRWCKGALNTLKVHASIDIPTFVTFLAEVESPYEVHDYIRSYLGDSKEVKEFAKQYLERRSKARNAQKENMVEDDILAPAPAVNPTCSEFQEVKQTRNKKGNKKKMQKVDSSILGFSVSSNERINVGERDYVE